jgi:hypothetical protein
MHAARSLWSLGGIAGGFAFVAASSLGAAPAYAKCTTLAFSVNDYGRMGRRTMLRPCWTNTLPIGPAREA